MYKVLRSTGIEEKDSISGFFRRLLARTCDIYLEVLIELPPTKSIDPKMTIVFPPNDTLHLSNHEFQNVHPVENFWVMIAFKRGTQPASSDRVDIKFYFAEIFKIEKCCLHPCVPSNFNDRVG